MASPGVLLVNMPFLNLRWPNLAMGLLAGSLHERGIACDTVYWNFDFAERIGFDGYQWLADCFAFVAGGERLFAKDYFGDRLPDDESYFREVLLPMDSGMTAEDYRAFLAIGQQVRPFLDACVEKVDWSLYAVVAFSATFQQTMASISLARRIKERCSSIRIVLGGAACEGPMGREMAAVFPELDYVFLGEADTTFPALMEQVLGGGPVVLPPDVVGQAAAKEPSSSPLPAAIGLLDDLPFPDFDAYFTRLCESPLAAEVNPTLFFETSRGCWWGQKHHCLFCGLNGSRLAYRSKSPRRSVGELRHLVRRYGVRQACASDCVLGCRDLDEFLRLFREADLGLSFGFEMKTNLTRAQVDRLVEAGLGSAQLGIETFLTPVLKLLGKGATAIQNLQALKWFSQAGIDVKWNLLYGVPNEDPREYATLAELIPLLVHLKPPMRVGNVRMDRFSPMFDDPAALGLVRCRPYHGFHWVYPFAEDVLARLVYYFEFEYGDGRRPMDYVTATVEATQAWQRLEGRVTLRYDDRPDGVLLIHDTRPCAAMFQHRLVGLAREIYLCCDTGQSWRNILTRCASVPAGEEARDEASIQRLLDQMIADRLMVHLDGRYLSLAMAVPTPDGGKA